MRSARKLITWWLLFSIGFATLLVATPWATGRLSRWDGRRPGRNPLLAVTWLRAPLFELGQSPATSTRKRIAYLGDSTVVTHDAGRTLPVLLGQRLAEHAGTAPAPLVFSVAAQGVGMNAFYYLADEIVASRPDLIVWQTSFTHLSDGWRGIELREPLVGLLATERIPEAVLLPTGRLGVTADEILYYKLVVSSGLFHRWRLLRDEQSRLHRQWRSLERRLSPLTSTTPIASYERRVRTADRLVRIHHDQGRQRFVAHGERAHYGDALIGIEETHPVLQLFAAGLAVFERAGIPVIVYLNPINVDNLRYVKVLDVDRLEASVDVLRHISVQRGAVFVDLHDLFTDEYFDDAAGHFRRSDANDGPAELIDALAPVVERTLRASAPRASPES